jgi:hypothetical protein
VGFGHKNIPSCNRVTQTTQETKKGNFKYAILANKNNFDNLRLNLPESIVTVTFFQTKNLTNLFPHSGDQGDQIRRICNYWVFTSSPSVLKMTEGALFPR